MNETKGSIKVFIADDHLIVREGIKALLSTEDGIDVIGDAGDGKRAVDEVARLNPDVILMDLLMPGMDGIEAIGHIKNSQPDARILVLTSFATDDKVFPALRAGALGFLLKDSPPEMLVDGIRQVYRGESWLHPKIARKVIQELTKSKDEKPGANQLTDRELEVLRLLAQGYSNQDIADQLVLSEATVRTHVSHILSKLHLTSRTQAALYALREGLANLDDSE
jgi:two-component system, NarL family, response regulator LiaR